MSVAKYHPAQSIMHVREYKERVVANPELSKPRKSPSIDLEPRFSTAEVPGKCLKCFAEQELGSCLRLLLTKEEEDRELKKRYSTLLTFLQSEESKELRGQTERLLSEGKNVKVLVYSKAGKIQCELVVSEPTIKEEDNK
jgi:hypothetical protein